MTNLNRVSRPGSWIAIECDLDTLNQIRAAAAEASANGGDAGGLLLGSLNDERLSIWGFEPIACEHAFGAAFVLSPTDRAGLAEQIQLHGGAEGSGRRQVVGWYRSHLHGGIDLTTEDLALYAEYFPESWQVAMALSPDAREGMQAGFFFRPARTPGSSAGRAAGRGPGQRVGRGMSRLLGEEAFVFDLDTLAAVRANVSQAAQGSPHPGPNLAGLLTGSRKGERVCIDGFEPLPPEQAARAGMREPRENALVEDRIRDGSRPAGWYHFQIRGEVSLTVDDLRVHEKLFPAGWQPALVVRVYANGSAHAAFFFKEPALVAQSASVLERIAVPEVAAPAEAERIPVPVQRVAAGRRSAEEPAPVPHPGVALVSPRASSSLALTGPSATPEQWLEKVQGEYRGPHRLARTGSGWMVWAILGLMFAVCAGAVLYLRLNYGTPARAQSHNAVLRVQAAQRDGNIEISWDPQAVGNALIGNLEIQDGDSRQRMVLDDKVLGLGKLSYPAKSDVTGFRLHVERPDGSMLEGGTTFVASVPASVAPPVAADVPSAPEGRPVDDPIVHPAPAQLAARQQPVAAARIEAVKPLAAPVHTPAPTPVPTPAPQHAKFVAPPSRAPRAVSAPVVDQPTLVAQSTPQNALNLPRIGGPTAMLPPPPVPSSTPAPAAKTGLDLAGHWSLQPGAPSRSPAVPALVSINVADRDGSLQGTLEARYHASGRTERVSLQFSGKPVNGSARFQWKSNDGHRGHIEFVRVPNSPNSVEVVWYAADGKEVFDEIVRKAP